jgi:hypothetical protein
MATLGTLGPCLLKLLDLTHGLLKIALQIYALYLPAPIMHKHLLRLPGSADTAVRFFAGQPDRNDSARFTIRYDVGVEQCELEGVLKDDDIVDLRVIRGVGEIGANH